MENCLKNKKDPGTMIEQELLIAPCYILKGIKKVWLSLTYITSRP